MPRSSSHWILGDIENVKWPAAGFTTRRPEEPDTMSASPVLWELRAGNRPSRPDIATRRSSESEGLGQQAALRLARARQSQGQGDDARPESDDQNKTSHVRDVSAHRANKSAVERWGCLKP